MSNSPCGFDLGRFIAAERNAQTGARGVGELESKLSELLQRVRKNEAELVRVKEENASLRGLLQAFRGNGPTA